jgi:hypothetical protein
VERNTSTDSVSVRSSENDVIVHAPFDLDETTVRKRHVATVYGLLHSTQYHFVVIAVNDLGEGARSLPSQAANTLGSTLPGFPYFLKEETAVSSDRLTVQWRLIDTGGLPCTFHVFLIDTADSSFTLNRVGFVGDTITLTGLLASRTYAVRINATNDVGTGSITEAIYVTTTAAVVPYDTASRVEVLTSDSESVSMTWTAPEMTGGSSSIMYLLEIEEVSLRSSQILTIEMSSTVNIVNLTKSSFYLSHSSMPGVRTICLPFNSTAEELKNELQRVFTPVVWGKNDVDALKY